MTPHQLITSIQSIRCRHSDAFRLLVLHTVRVCVRCSEQAAVHSSVAHISRLQNNWPGSGVKAGSAVCGPPMEAMLSHAALPSAAPHGYYCPHGWHHHAILSGHMPNYPSSTLYLQEVQHCLSCLSRSGNLAGLFPHRIKRCLLSPSFTAQSVCPRPLLLSSTGTLRADPPPGYVSASACRRAAPGTGLLLSFL